MTGLAVFEDMPWTLGKVRGVCAGPFSLPVDATKRTALIHQGTLIWFGESELAFTTPGCPCFGRISPLGHDDRAQSTSSRNHTLVYPLWTNTSITTQSHKQIFQFAWKLMKCDVECPSPPMKVCPPRKIDYHEKNTFFH